SCHLRLRGPLDVDALRAALQTLADRHDALRATVAADGDRQRFAKHLRIDLSILDVPDEAALAARLDAEDREPFDLARGPLRPAERSYRGARATVALGPELARAVRRAAARLGRTPYALLFAAYQALLRRLSGAGDLVVGIPTAGQALEGAAALVGHCVHFLPI